MGVVGEDFSFVRGGESSSLTPRKVNDEYIQERNSTST